ncbi:MAG: DUF4910 domain-containing protein [Acidimicrobiales bacterium]|nr:DUF4910 domain-containing protein [Acidimicrobiales bacterium]
MYALVERLFPLLRGRTGDGVRETLRLVGEVLPLTLHEVPTGTPVFDWTVPREWRIRDAYVADAAGRRVIDLADSTLHLVSESVPLHRRMSLDELRPHLHSLPDRPDVIPYRTAYGGDGWGFCLAHRDLEAMAEGDYEVCIDGTLEPGHLTYGEAVIPGETDDEVLLWAHCCHPSLANDNLSGIAVVAMAGALLAQVPTRHTYRVVVAPATIGAITWLAGNEDSLGRLCHGLVVAGVGDPGPLTYKRSRRGGAAVDRAAAHVLAGRADGGDVVDFSPYGYDERQFCSPGFDLPVGRLSRTPFGTYPEYHTSADDLGFVRPASLAASLDALLAVLDVLERDGRWRNTSPKGEPQLGRRGLYATPLWQRSGGPELGLLWVLNLSDGRHSLLDVAERSGLTFDEVAAAAAALAEVGLLVPCDP